MKSSSKRFPLKNLVNTEVSGTDLLVDFKGGTHLFTPNTAVIHSLRGALPLGEPVGLSDISGEPGYLLRTQSHAITLTHSELCRLFLQNLTPKEYFALAEKFGAFNELREYDDVTGIALAPRYSDAEQTQQKALRAVPHVLVHVGPNGTARAHSLVGYDEALTARIQWAQRGVRLDILPLQSPRLSKAAKLQAFDNVILLYAFEDGSLLAEGPFLVGADAEAEAWAWSPKFTSDSPLRSTTILSFNTLQAMPT